MLCSMTCLVGRICRRGHNRSEGASRPLVSPVNLYSHCVNKGRSQSLSSAGVRIDVHGWAVKAEVKSQPSTSACSYPCTVVRRGSKVKSCRLKDVSAGALHDEISALCRCENSGLLAGQTQIERRSNRMVGDACGAPSHSRHGSHSSF